MAYYTGVGLCFILEDLAGEQAILIASAAEFGFLAGEGELLELASGVAEVGGDQGAGREK